MKQLQYFLAALTILLSINKGIAQSFKVPLYYKFDNADSYHKYDMDIIKCVNWLEKAILGYAAPEVKNASRFLLEFQTGCTYVGFVQNMRIDAYLSDCPQYRIYYIGGWIRYSLQNLDNANKITCTYAGIKTVLKAYKANRVFKPDANLDELATLEGKGKLKEWVEEKLN